MKKVFILLFYLLGSHSTIAQFPWNRPLMMAWSADGITFNTPVLFQDSSGVPSAIKWKGDTLVAVFQWFRAPNPSPTWDRVAVKYSYDNGISWTQPQPIIVNGLPSNYQRPFDPTLAVLNSDSLRIYFSSSIGIPIGLDSTVNTYSAVSTDGLNWDFEPLPRVDEVSNKVIDPAVHFFNNGWHYTAPIGAPQQGAYHYVSPDGINFSKVPDIPSDPLHNWTGNLVVESNTELRFYGSSQNNIWFNSTPNGGAWNGYIDSNLPGGDPSVVKTGLQEYLIIYVGLPYNTSINENINAEHVLFPNPCGDVLFIERKVNSRNQQYCISDMNGKIVRQGMLQETEKMINVNGLSKGNYFLVIENIPQFFTKIK